MCYAYPCPLGQDELCISMPPISEPRMHAGFPHVCMYSVWLFPLADLSHVYLIIRPTLRIEEFLPPLQGHPKSVTLGSGLHWSIHIGTVSYIHTYLLGSGHL